MQFNNAQKKRNFPITKIVIETNWETHTQKKHSTDPEFAIKVNL